MRSKQKQICIVLHICFRYMDYKTEKTLKKGSVENLCKLNKTRNTKF